MNITGFPLVGYKAQGGLEEISLFEWGEEEEEGAVAIAKGVEAS